MQQPVTPLTSQQERSRLKVLATLRNANIWYMVVTLATSQLVMSPLKLPASPNMVAMLVTLLTSQLEMLALKVAALWKRYSMLAALPTSQPETSLLKLVAR